MVRQCLPWRTIAPKRVLSNGLQFICAHTRSKSIVASAADLFSTPLP